MNRVAVFITAIIVIALIFSCANQSPPGGGPEDKTPPELISASPLYGAVNVDPRTVVTFHFSEWISASASAVTVYPRLSRRPDVRVVRNRLEVRPKVPLAPNTTYLVVIGTTLKDLRGNALPERALLMFSTGDSMDESILDVLKPEEEEKTDADVNNTDADTDNTDIDTDNIDINTDNADIETDDADVDTGNINIDTDNADVDTDNIDTDTDNTDSDTGETDNE